MKNTKKHLIQGWSIILVTLLFVVPGIVYAINTVATGFQVNATAKIIDAHGTCHNVSTTDGSTQFVATKTSAEWASFRNNTPAGVSLGSCYTPLIMTVKTNDLSPPGGVSTTNNTSFHLALDTTANYDVDWNNDGVYEQTNITGPITHDFGTTGTYTIRIRGELEKLDYKIPSQDNHKIYAINQWGNYPWSTMEEALEYTSNLEILATDAPNLANVTSMKNMFREADKLNQSIDHWDVSNVTDMTGLFQGAATFNQPLNSWDVSNVTNMYAMFSGADAFNQPLNSWNVGNVTQISFMFSGADAFNQPLNSWNMSSATDISFMFNQATSFNQPLNSWNVSNVTQMYYTFGGASSFNRPLDSWNTSNVTIMQQMFFLASSFDQNISGWNVSNVTLYASFDTGTPASWTAAEKPNF